MNEWCAIGTAFAVVLGLFIRYEVVMEYYWNDLHEDERVDYPLAKAIIQFWKDPEDVY